MTAFHYLSLVAIGLVMIGWGTRLHAEDDVTIYSAPSTSASATPSSVTVTADGTPVVHKSSHRHKKKSTIADKDATPGDQTATASPSTAANKKTTAASAGKKSTPAPTITVSAPVPAAGSPPVLPSPPPAPSAPITVAKSPSDSHSQITVSAPATHPAHLGSGPEVETGLPVARHGAGGTTMTGSSSTIPNNTTLPHENYQVASAFPLSPVIPVTATAGSYLPGRSHSTTDNFTFTNFDRHVKNLYPWKSNIITTKFWIGEGGTPISSTTNEASAWDQDWRNTNGGTDTPDDRSGYASGRHAALHNPFYVALPFNDLAFPEKARRWLPAGWYRPPKNGKQVSACQHRWVEIKNAQGDVCYAQWEDVGPLRYDHAEYVFGNERPDTYTRAGLDVSPAVFDYLNLSGKNCLTRWRFVDDADVPPGYWLQYDEQALLFKAMKNAPNPSIDALRAPIGDQDDVDSNKKKVGAAKG